MQILKKVKGSELVGKTYKPMFPYFASLKAAPGSSKGAFRVVADGYVTSDAGTGVVHQAPFFGEDDYRVCKKFGELCLLCFACVCMLVSMDCVTSWVQIACKVWEW